MAIHNEFTIILSNIKDMFRLKAAILYLEISSSNLYSCNKAFKKSFGFNETFLDKLFELEFDDIFKNLGFLKHHKMITVI